MTKFVLHGGFNKEEGYIKDGFFREALKDTGARVKILLVFFAETPELVELRMKQCKEQFVNNKGTKELEFKLATEETFAHDCLWADVIFMSGGSTVRIREVLEKFVDLKQLFTDKIVTGDSAGVNVLAHLSYSRKAQKINGGLGVLPFNTVPHYSAEIGNPFADTDPDTEVLFLHEYETVVKYV